MQTNKHKNKQLELESLHQFTLRNRVYKPDRQAGRQREAGKNMYMHGWQVLK